MPTALDLTNEELTRYLKAARGRPAPSALTSFERAERQALLRRVTGAAAVLKAQFGARRVILFGSLAHEGWFVPDSDVDLAVEGLQGDYWQAWRAAEEIIRDREVDLIEVESAPDSLQRAIERYGVEL